MTDWISRHSLDESIFIPRMFEGFPEMKEALIADRLQAGFLVAPLAIALRSQGVPIKIVYLGHRYGSAVVVHRDGGIRAPRDLRGKTIAVPSRFSDERLIVLKVLKENGLGQKDVKMVEMAPPDAPSALAARAIDAFAMGEPFPSQAEMDGYGRVLFQAREHWPDYISCVLVVREDAIAQRGAAVQTLVDGIARSGLWLDKGRPQREYAAEFVGRYYYRQRSSLLRWALTNPLDRITYAPLSPTRPDFELIMRLMHESGVLDQPVPFADLVDTRFAEGAEGQAAWSFDTSR